MDGGLLHILISCAAIRARAAADRLPVQADEWDEADYRHQRQQAYREALAAAAPGLALAWAADAAELPACECLARCPATGDVVGADPALKLEPALRSRILAAVQRVHADACGWRRSLRPAYFERHRAWRARVGAPVQH